VAAGFDHLSRVPTAFGPANDGGYYLIGLSRIFPELFYGIAWGTDSVLTESRRVLLKRGLEPALLESLDDLDRPEDLRIWQRIAEHEDANLTRISVIIPALNEASRISRTLATASLGRPHELLVVDGGSTDETRELALQAGANVLLSPPGRSRQMNLGAARASGDVLLFLHADTLLPPSWPGSVLQILERPGVAAGAFAFRIGESFTGKRLVEWTTNLRSRWFRMPYGDQALFLRRSLLEELGGFADLPIMEDYELVKRLRRAGSIITATNSAITSGRRWRRLGIVRTTFMNKLMVAGYRLGVCPHRLARLYRGSQAAQ
jgi:rSAM/selenodomain-associated transferase 2